jgi:hypothetical protein
MPAAIETYTLRQLMAYAELGARRESTRDKGMAGLMRSAYHSQPEQWKKLLASFGDD